MTSQNPNGNGPKVYQIGLSGKELHDLISHLEANAVETENYFELRVCVYLGERIRHEARAAGWPKGIEPEALRVYRPEGLPAGIG